MPSNSFAENYPSPNVVSNLLKVVQEEAGPAVWSRGVALTRLGVDLVSDSLSNQECIIHVRIPGKAVSPKVTLWPEEEEWDCDCRSSESPCEHVAAAVIFLRQNKIMPLNGGAATTSLPAEGATSNTHAQALAHLEYHFVSTKGPRYWELSIYREVVSSAGREKLAQNILSYKSRVNRTKGAMPDLLSNQADFHVEQVLKTYQNKSLERNRLEALFKAIEPDQKVFLDGDPLEISTAMLLPKYECIDEADGYRLRRISNPDITKQFRFGVALCGHSLHLMKSTFLSPEEQELCEGEGSYWGPEREGTLFNKILPSLGKKIVIEITSLKAPQTLDLPPRIDLLLEKDTLHDGRFCLSVVANLVYGDPEIARLNPNTMELVSQGSSFKDRKRAHGLSRSVDKERELLRKLSKELNLQIGRHTEYQDRDAVDFCAKLGDWDFRGQEAFALFSPQDRVLAPNISINDFGDAAAGSVEFSVKFLLARGEAESVSEIDFRRVMNAWEMNEDYVPLLDGSWARVPKDWMDRYAKKIQDFLLSRDATKIVVPKHEQYELATLCEELGQDIPDSAKQLKDLVENFAGIQDTGLPSDLKAELRGYQKKGVNWLQFLKDAGLGAMLADDMGLGKTLQTICVLEKRSIVVAPTSVIYNWGEEIKKFRPSLSVSYFYGPDRKLDLDSDVVLTSYGVLRMDLDKIKEQEWKIAVLDEAQVIKNPDSQVAKAAHGLKADFKIALTGTPVENHLKDLWSQFHFINPGMLGGLDEFNENFGKPILRGEANMALKLKRRIKPFILRRLKKEVATELPDKTESLLHCELNHDERDFYNMLMSSTRKEVMNSLEEGGSIMQALELILRLRQACCHRAMVPGAPGEEVSSSKLTLLMDSLVEATEEGHKCLVFSQWTSFLDLIGAELKRNSLNYLRIDGSTKNRQDIVNRFQGDGAESVMLISLKAGGVGLNLTAADHVYIMDPWWNPAVEDQAADRAYRIGQKNPVFVHRLVAKDTLEEKIVALQEKKKDLARAVLDEGGAALSLSRSDIMDLLS